jgi:hypothetical protein
VQGRLFARIFVVDGFDRTGVGIDDHVEKIPALFAERGK